MDGITIVKEHLCRLVELNEFVTGVIYMTLLCIGILFLYRFMYKDEDTNKETKTLISFCSTAFVILYVLFLGLQINSYHTTHMEYTVIVDDSISINDFYEKYEILSVNGNEYRVIENN